MFSAPINKVGDFFDATRFLRPGTASQHRVLDEILRGEAAVLLPGRQDLYIDEPIDLRGGRRLLGAQAQSTRIRMRDTTQPVIISGRRLVMSGGAIAQVGGEHNEVGHLRLGYEAEHVNPVPALALAGPMVSSYHDLYIYRCGIGIGFLNEAGHNGGSDNQGLGAVLAVTLTAGGASAVTIASGGAGYGTVPPTITVTGDGYGMRLRAVISGGSVTGVVIDDPGVGYTSALADVIPGNRCQFSNMFSRLNIRNCGVAFIDLRATTGQTGSHFDTIYCNGYRDDGSKNVIDAGILLGTGDEDVFHQINIEHTKIRNYAIHIGSDCGPKSFTSLHMEGLDLVTDSGKSARAYIRVSNSGAQPRLSIDGWSIVYSDLTVANLGATVSAAGVALIETGGKAQAKITGFVERANTVDVAKWIPASPAWSGSVAMADGDSAVIFEIASVTTSIGGTYSAVMRLDRASQPLASDGRTPVLRRFGAKRYGPEADHLGYVAGRYYAPRAGVVLPTTATIAAANTLYAGLIRVEEEVAIDAIGMRIVSGQPGGAVKAAIYAINPSAPHKPDGGRLLGETPSAAATESNADVALVVGAPGAPSTPAPVRIKRFAWVVVKATATATLPSTIALNEQTSRELGAASPGAALSFTSGSLKGYGAVDLFASNFPSSFPASFEVTTAVVPIPAWRCAETT